MTNLQVKGEATEMYSKIDIVYFEMKWWTQKALGYKKFNSA